MGPLAPPPQNSCIPLVLGEPLNSWAPFLTSLKAPFLVEPFCRPVIKSWPLPVFWLKAQGQRPSKEHRCMHRALQKLLLLVTGIEAA